MTLLQFAALAQHATWIHTARHSSRTGSDTSRSNDCRRDRIRKCPYLLPRCAWQRAPVFTMRATMRAPCPRTLRNALRCL